MKLRRIKIFNQVLENCRFCQNSGNEANGRSWEGVGAYCLHHYDALHRKVDIYIYIIYIYILYIYIIYIYIYISLLNTVGPYPKNNMQTQQSSESNKTFWSP